MDFLGQSRMKPANHAPFFACIYHGLCDTARKHGYALTIHGTLNHDMDLVAIPWTEEAISAEDLRAALMKHLTMCGYDDVLRRSGYSEEYIKQRIEAGEIAKMDGVEKKPHGRLAWNLYLMFGAKVDLSVMPRILQ